MLCDRCHRGEGEKLMTRTSGGTTTRRRYCRSCVEELGLDNPQDSIVLFPWEAQGPNSFSFAGVIARVQPDTVTLRTERSTHYRPGTLLNIKAALVPPGLRRPGAKFSFNFPIEAVPAVLAGDGPVPDGGGAARPTPKSKRLDSRHVSELRRPGV